MSRYNVPSHDGLEHVVGWDNPMQTFYAQILDPSRPEDQSEVVLWVGDEPKALPTLEALKGAVQGRIAIPTDVVDKLERDFMGRTAPTPLQRWVIERFEEFEAYRSSTQEPQRGEGLEY